MYEGSLCHADFWICLTNQLMLWSFRDKLIRHLHVHVHCNCKEKCFTFSWRSRPDIGVQGLIQQLISKLQWLSLQSFACLDVVGEFQDLVLVLACIYQRLPNSNAKFVPFSPLSKHEIIISLSLIERTDHFCFVDMSFWVIIAFCVYIL